MKRLIIAAIPALLLSLTACDKVRVPGVNPTGQDAQEPTSDTIESGTYDTPETETVETPPPPQAEPVDVVETDPADGADEDETADATDPDADSDTDSGTEDDTDTASTDTDAGPDDAAPAVTSLAALNAKRCGLAEGDIATPTIGMVAGATEVEEPTVGTAAVNAMASQLINFPGIVKMEPRDILESGAVSSGHCGATRIAEHWFVSAAHCVDEDYQEIQLIAGSENIRSPMARTVVANAAICHGGYDGVNNGYSNDVALIRVSAEMSEALGDVPIANYGRTASTLAPINYPDVDMAGWGITSYGGQLSNHLLGATLKMNMAGPAMINVSSLAGAGPCIGDSGGPLFVTEADGSRTVIGVLSVVEQNRVTGEFCAGDYNGRYTNLQGYSEWITSVMALCEANEDMCQ